jgi:large subunit ribosomal protein L10
MVKTLSLLSLGFATAAAFTSQPLVSRTSDSTTSLFGGAAGYATSREGKTAKIERAKELLESSQMIFTIPVSGITVAQSQMLRRSMPETTTVSVIKNTLMDRAAEGTPYAAASSLLKGPNMWFFIEDDIKGSVSAYNSFIKFYRKEDSGIIGGVVDGDVYDGNGIIAIGKLPSKDELYAKIAGSINAIPTKVARIIKEPTSKLARAIKLATDEINKSE